MSHPSRIGVLSRKAVAGMATLALGVTLAGCSSSDDNEPDSSTTSTASGAEPVSGGAVTIGSYLDPSCLDPGQGGANASLLVTRQVVDNLTDLDPATGEVLPWIATSWDINEDYTSYTFTLRDDVTFSDGMPLDADAVVATFQGILDNADTAIVGQPYLKNVDTLTAVDPTTVEITMTTSSPSFLADTANTALGIVSPASYTDQTPDERCADGVIGSGPFVVDSYTTNDAVVLSKREDYAWPSSLWENQGAAYLDEITIQVLPEDSVRVGALQSGQTDVAYQIPEQSAPMFDGNGFTLITQANPGVAVSLNFNLNSPVASDPAVRHALMTAVNRDDLALVYGPSGVATAGYLSPTTPGAGDFSGELVYDPEAAEAILDEAGWIMADDGYRYKDGVELALDFPYFFDGPVVELMQQQFAEIGVRIDITQVTISDLLETMGNGDYDATVGNLTRPSVAALQALYTNAGTNWYGLSDPELEDALSSIIATADAAEQSARSDEAQQIMFDNAYGVPLHSLAQSYALRDGVNGLVFEATAKPVLHELWVTP